MLIVLVGFSCSNSDPQSYTKNATSRTKTEVDMSSKETVEEWQARVEAHFDANNIDLQDIWIEIDEDYVSFCGCFECRMGGTSMAIMSSADPSILQSMGFEH